MVIAANTVKFGIHLADNTPEESGQPVEPMNTASPTAKASPSSFRWRLAGRSVRPRRLETLESEHRPDSLLYPAMILLDHVVQIFAGSHPYPAR